MNKKMMLCAMVDGDIKDYQNMFLVHNKLPVIHCSCGRKPVATFDGYCDVVMPYHNKPVELKRFCFDDVIIGAVGRCSCGQNILLGRHN